MTTAATSAEPLDLLVVGGGPAGTAAAFRATEHGLSTLVVDYDDLMKRIRDYSKDKLILPSFGGGDRMRFPKGGECVSALCFGPIDKDDMCADWKRLYERFGVRYRVGVELTGVEPLPGGGYRALGWDHHQRAECAFAARHVVLAIGRGVPRRFDIPGNTDGIVYRLTNASAYVGAPACVLGGGTSAAEAVIAISNAKAAAGDPTAVYWSYRGDKMPRVSKALAGVFFEAYVGNGNLRYFPKSEPAAVVTADDRQEYLAIRVDRRTMAGRPAETTQLEFPKAHCLACIGEDIPEGLLAELGISMVVGGPRNKKRMVVNRMLESVQPAIYLAGDLLSQAYFETDDFDADPAGFREVKHRGNIKSALRDGVLVADVVRQRLAGKTEIDVTVEDAEEPEASRRVAVSVPHDDTSAELRPESLAAERAESASEACLVRLLPTGVEAEEFPVREHGVTTIGRGGCDLTFPDDSTLSPLHGSISHTEEGYLVRDDGSAGGVFLQVPVARKRDVADGDLLRAGRQFLVLQTGGDRPLLLHYDRHGAEVGRHALAEGTLVLGRDAPGITLDADDATLSRRHLALTVENGRAQVKDLKSVNGTFLRVRTALRLEEGDRIRMGQQILAFRMRGGTGRLGEAATAAQPVSATRPATAEPPAVDARPAAATLATPATVTFAGGSTVEVRAGETLCEAAERCGVAITAECHSGICGSDPIRILSGHDNVVGEAGDGERETLEEICALDPAEHRLACMVRIRGPVEVERVGE